MKKFILPLLAVFAMVLTTSCTDESMVFTQYYTITAYDWSKPAGVNYYVSDWTNPDITPAVVDHGAVVAYVVDNNRYNQLPYILPYTTDNGNVVPENLRFEWGNGMVRFILEDLDGYEPEHVDQIPNLSFKVCTIL